MDSYGCDDGLLDHILDDACTFWNNYGDDIVDIGQVVDFFESVNGTYDLNIKEGTIRKKAGTK